MRKQLSFAVLGLGALVYGAFSPVGSLSQPEPARKASLPPLNFNRDVKPILSEHCFRCHGPDAGSVAAGLRLDTFDLATKSRDGRRGIVPGKPAESLLWMRINHPVPEVQMPPMNSGVARLSPAQKRIIHRWILGGAKYQEHWAFVPPKMPALPAVSNPKWARNDIDRFVLAALDRSKLKPEPEADKRTLIRRASLALTGLPPSPEEIRLFLSDSSPQAYEKAVDRLLASPRYGENQARYWLDAVRYGDTHGLHLDNERAIYPYRDWVVSAYNRDLPFNEFAVEQLAGDLLPNPTIDQLVATGYVRMNPTTAEGGAIEEEFLAKNTFDRVDTTSTVFLGLTVACARCHDHKYDPIRQKDYFQLYAFFNSTADNPLDGNELAPAPAIRAATPEQAAQLSSMRTRLEEIESAISLDSALDWLNHTWVAPLKLEALQKSPVYEAKSFEEAFATVQAPERGDPVTWAALNNPLTQPVGIVGKENAAVYVRGVIRVPSARTVRIRFGSDDGAKVWLNGTQVFELKGPRGIPAQLDEFDLNLTGGLNAVLIKLVNGGGGDALVVKLATDGEERMDAMARLWKSGATAKRDPKALVRFFLAESDSAPNGAEWRDLSRRADEFEQSIPLTLIAKELSKPREARIMRRGEYNLKGALVQRALPASLGALPKEAPRNRLGFARWLSSDRNPLVARVYVNRIWQQHFGVGIVRTAEDFGAQGEWPTNPELLDYLAVRFKQDGWSTKALHRHIVTSATFRQRSSVDKLKLEKDPENRLNSRGPRFRLPAEVIRDRALLTGGLLVEKQGGRGFGPTNPTGYGRPSLSTPATPPSTCATRAPRSIAEASTCFGSAPARTP
jgi:hypothetical protein